MLAHDTGPKLSFDRMKEARKFKAELKRLTSSDDAYYSVLERFGVKHFDQVPEGHDPEKYAALALESLRMEVNVQAWEAASPRVTKLFVPFNHYKELEQVRADLEGFGAGDFYKKTLKRYGAASISELPVAQGTKAYKELCLELNRVKEENGLESLLGECAQRLDSRLFLEIMKRHDCATITEVLALPADPLGALLKELKFFVDEEKAKV